jgi:predicted nucleic acid-binding protein
MVVVDTSTWIDYIHGTLTPETDALDYELSQNAVITGDLIVAEFLQGFRTDKEFAEAKLIMDSLIYYNFTSKDIAVQSAINYRFLRSQGVTVRKTTDMIIGTFCLAYGFPLLHNDRDFDHIAQFLGLEIYGATP